MTAKCSTKIHVTTVPSLSQSNWGERSSRLVKQKVLLKERKEKNLKRETNGNFNDICVCSADENK
jgi:hypothetical protein